jgi:FlaA1/EpsC-like NDP-sugar epimerase
MERQPRQGLGLEHRSWKLRLAQTLARTRVDLSFALVDALLIIVAYSAALVLRFMDLEGVPADWLHGFLIALPIILLVHLSFNVVFGAYGHVWKYASVEEAMRLVAATSVSLLVLLAGLVEYRHLSGGEEGLIPLMVLAVGAGLTLGGMGAVRFRARLFSFRRHGEEPEPERTLVVGTGRVAADLVRHAGSQIKVLAFVGHDGEPVSSRRLAGLPVIGSLDDIPEFVEWLGVSQVVIAAPLDDQALRRLVDGCMDSDVRLRIVPGIDDVLADGATLRDARDLQIADLLPRQPVSTDLARVDAILHDKRILVTGAGGSIGAEIVQQVLQAGPEMVLALDNDETHLFNADLQWSSDIAHPVLCDIRDLGALRSLISSTRPQVVFHAAAHKHVPLLESFPQEAAKTNVLGTANLLEALADTDIEQFVLISTDKAVDPTSAMGASKRFAELLVQSAATDGRPGVYSAVRFGNVLGSRGSVVPTFMHQIQHGGPVTVSDPRMERYFMTVSEAVQLVLQASALASGGEVFVLDMGEPVRIVDLARRMIRLAGLVPGRDVDVEVIGARPGEKIREILSLQPLQPSAHPKIRIATPPFPDAGTLGSAVHELASLIERDDLPGVRSMLDSMAWQNWATHVRVDLDALEESKHEAM